MKSEKQEKMGKVKDISNDWVGRAAPNLQLPISDSC